MNEQLRPPSLKPGEKATEKLAWSLREALGYSSAVLLTFISSIFLTSYASHEESEQPHTSSRVITNPEAGYEARQLSPYKVLLSATLVGSQETQLHKGFDAIVPVCGVLSTYRTTGNPASLVISTEQQNCVDLMTE